MNPPNAAGLGCAARVLREAQGEGVRFLPMTGTNVPPMDGSGGVGGVYPPENKRNLKMGGVE
jgi:hypothetical protein